jgi:hypothetical protein
MRKITPSEALFIKLGRKGIWTDECVNEGKLKLSYHEAQHESLSKGDFSVVDIAYQDRSRGVISGFKTQIRHFYDSDENVLWVTFHNEKLWWCFAEKQVEGKEDGTKEKKTIGNWSSKNLKGEELILNDLSGNLLKTQGFQGTICKIQDIEYLVRKINGEETPEVLQANEDINRLKDSIGACIKKLTPKDFELLIDLIFRQAGYLRTNTIGGPQKTKDIELLSPVTNERILI